MEHIFYTPQEEEELRQLCQDNGIGIDDTRELTPEEIEELKAQGIL